MKKILKIIIGLLFAIIFLLVQALFLDEEDTEISDNKELHEADYVNMYCKGEKEYILPDKTRIDCLTKTSACEFDWAKKWYEGFGQALWYSYNTGKKPCLVLILTSNEDYKYFNRAKILSEKYEVELIEIKAENFK